MQSLHFRDHLAVAIQSCLMQPSQCVLQEGIHVLSSIGSAERKVAKNKSFGRTAKTKTNRKDKCAKISRRYCLEHTNFVSHNSYNAVRNSRMPLLPTVPRQSNGYFFDKIIFVRTN